MKKELIIITGAGQGIGKYLAQFLIKKFDLIVISKSSNCKKLSQELNTKKKNICNFVIMDLSKKINTKKIIKKINLNKYSNIHFIFAAGYLENFSKKININDWKKAFNVNFFSHLEILNSFLFQLQKIKKESRIIFFSGGGAANSFPEFPAYSASKTALVRTVENLALKYNKFNISFFAIAPGAIKTKMLKKVLKHSNVNTQTSKAEVLKFIDHYFCNSSKKLNGKLIHIRDDKNKIEINKKLDYLKLRRVE